MASPWHTRPYTDGADLQAMLDLLRRARPPERVSEYPTPGDLHELNGRSEVLAHTRLWFDAAERLLGWAWLDEYNNLLIEFDPACGPALAHAQLDWAIPAVWQLAGERGEPDAPQTSLSSTNLEKLAVLQERGFRLLPDRSVHLARSLAPHFPAPPIPPPHLPPGFSLRPCRGADETEAWVALHQAAFGSEKMSSDWRAAMLSAPDYNPELDLLVVAPDGRLAAYCVGGIPAEENALSGQKIAYTDPVATHPDFQRLGLASSLLLAAMQRLQALGVQEVRLGTSGDNLAMQAAARKAGFEIVSETLWFEAPPQG